MATKGFQPWLDVDDSVRLSADYHFYGNHYANSGCLCEKSGWKGSAKLHRGKLTVVWGTIIKGPYGREREEVRHVAQDCEGFFH